MEIKKKHFTALQDSTSSGHLEVFQSSNYVVHSTGCVGKPVHLPV
jgi:hypothetical protein